MRHTSHSPEETKQIAKEFAASLQGGEIVALEGDLGAGKTTFVKGLAEALGVSEEARSPTFAIMNLYETSQGAIKRLVHLDCYRLKTPEDIQNLGLDEWLGDPSVVVLLEWPRAVREVPVEADVEVQLVRGTSDDERTITILRNKNILAR